jgi:hypothetical protein
MKRKSVLAILVLTIVLSVVVSVTAAADCGCGCDCGCATDCSPGYWKNHTDWMSDLQWADSPWGDAEDMYDILWARGNDPLFAYRFDVADALNDADYPWANCND